VLVVAGEETTLSSQMAGKIRKVHVGLGDSVARGAVLVDFDCLEQEAQIQAAQAEYRGLRETHLAKMKLQALGAAGELEVTVAAAAADKAKSQVDLRESQVAYCSVQAPFSGNIARLRVKTAESVNLGQPLIELLNTSSLKAQMFVPANMTGVAVPGTIFQVRIDDGRVFRARVAKTNSRVEGVSQQLEIEGRFEGPTRGLLPGMVGTAIFPVRSKR
jgi:membrane fusion protein (multidrug efflux system)